MPGTHGDRLADGRWPTPWAGRTHHASGAGDLFARARAAGTPLWAVDYDARGSSASGGRAVERIRFRWPAPSAAAAVAELAALVLLDPARVVGVERAP